MEVDSVSGSVRSQLSCFYGDIKSININGVKVSARGFLDRHFSVWMNDLQPTPTGSKRMAGFQFN
ncbi:hypothetical protein E3U43_015590 [Larimichthys crocea]|uniref:Uncharacterized protein n=1 Tax=Larimichthys crocea TaxID=215358 RepID=A0ACD3RQK0_LARCR|nr:hypothetical protein E3U43_015590 [Larimichthys crocea]